MKEFTLKPSMMSNPQLIQTLIGNKLKGYQVEEIFSMDEDELRYHKLTNKQIHTIQTIKELFKRMSKVDYVNEESLSNPGKIVDWVRFNIGFKNNEEFYVMYMNAAGKVIKSESMFIGNKNACTIGVDEVMRKAILLKAYAFVVCHNHSQNPSPSFADKKITKELKSAGELLSIKLLDHIIVTKDSYFSFLKEGLL